MARIMEFTDASGVTHPASYWTVEDMSIKPWARCATFLFIGFPTQALAALGKSPFPERIKVECDGAKFIEYLTRNRAGEFIGALAYALADERNKFLNSDEAPAMPPPPAPEPPPPQEPNPETEAPLEG